MKKTLLLMSLLGLLIACNSPIKRVYNEDTETEDLKEISKSLNDADVALLLTIRLEDRTKFKNKTYLQILDSIKEAHLKWQLEQEKLREEQERLREEQPLYPDLDSLFGHFKKNPFYKDDVAFTIRGVLTNITDKTFVMVKFFENDADSNVEWIKRKPHVEIKLNDIFRLSSPYTDKKIIKSVFPTASYEKPWKPNETRKFIIHLLNRAPGFNNREQILKPVHFNYDPIYCRLKIPIYLEDANGYKKQMFLKYDIKDLYQDYKNEIKK